MQLQIISLNQINPAGTSRCISKSNIQPLIVVKDGKQYHLVPGQDERLAYMKSIGIKEHPCYLLPGESSAYTLVCLRNLIAEYGRGGLIEFALQLIPYLELEHEIKVIKAKPIPGDFDVRGSNKLELTTDTNDVFTLEWPLDLACDSMCDLMGLAKYILYSHPNHPLKDKLYGLGSPDPFFAINIRNDYSCMFWDCEADWAKELDRRELEQASLN